MTRVSDESENKKQAGQAPEYIEAKRFPTVKKSELLAADDTPTYIVPVEDLPEVMVYLRDEGGFTLLEDVTAVDWKTEPRFQMVYSLLAVERAAVIRIKVNLSGTEPTIPSMTPIWPGANWYEREVYDLFGITFTEHPDLRRIEMPDDWFGHPLRKDYPLTGPRRPNLPANQFRTIGRSSQNQA